MDMIGISMMDPQWPRQEVIEKNPLMWLVEFNSLPDR